MQENMEQLFKAYEDSLRKLGMDEKIHRIDEVVVKAKKLDKAAEVYKTRTKSIAYYDVASEMDDIQDRNGFIGDDIHELMINMNSEFYREHSPGGQEYLFYKGRMVLFAINYERTYHNEMDYNKYRQSGKSSDLVKALASEQSMVTLYSMFPTFSGIFKVSSP